MVLEFCGSQTLKKFIPSSKSLKETRNEGQSFAVLEQSEIQETQAKFLFQQLIKGVIHLHSKGIFHRDLKLSNILVNSKKVLKIIDLGLATTQNDRIEAVVGTPSYFSPQAAAGTPYSARAQDVWCLGIILYELLYGVNPFYGTDLVKLRQLRDRVQK